ncbi:tetratricopeptide repeat protein [Amycolatopsis taiwanensis]|uniref:Tetratricopeptide repeat protein n=1 Tax=Amycolatopsis taiwanensis TaxID=342230 RepID=A0A9W6R5H6_9PSEU|nr:tetratricopeptide repeat protein [Amycolatopsis taiwanensis]GLY67932.1 hypothetical protein Atai01_45510 [Amycolatopsis taiwanensis]
MSARAGAGGTGGSQITQIVRAEAGHAYGQIDGDMHVFADRGPVYRLVADTAGRSGTAPEDDDAGPPAQPSHLLNAHSGVVAFTGRDTEVGELTAWLGSHASRAARWLHGPGGQGKTRLADHLAANAARAGWKVITAERTSGRVDGGEPTSQDLRIGAAAGLLLLIDYADRWPLAHLTLLFSNKILNQDVPVRVLLLARARHAWPALRHALTQDGWPPGACTARSLDPLPSTSDARARMFTAARDGFARRYRLPDAGAIALPDWLARDEFGLTLAVHMAALVAVDRHARPTPQLPLPDDLPGLTGYLLEREQHHWHTLHDNGTSKARSDPAGGRVAFDTTPEGMAQVVFTATLTGPLAYQDAKAALGSVGIGDADRALADHARCYPPADPRTVLEPMYPDRLAEDFLALCLPGHPMPSPTPPAWADGAPGLLLAPPADGGPPPYTARAITFLAAASDRWPHLMPTLEALDTLLPDDPSGALAIAAADLAERITPHRLARTEDPAERAHVHADLGKRRVFADRHEKAEDTFREAVRLFRPLAEADPLEFEPDLTEALAFLAAAQVLQELGGDWMTASANLIIRGSRWTHPAKLSEALDALSEAREISLRLARQNPAEYREGAATLAGGVAATLMRLERTAEALVPATEVVDLVRPLARDHSAKHEAHLAGWLDFRAVILNELDRFDEALRDVNESVEIYRRLAHDNPAEHTTALQSALERLARVLNSLGRPDESLHAIHEALRIARRLARDNAPGHEEGLLSALEQLAQILPDQGRWEEALAPTTEAVALARRLAQDNPAKHEGRLVGVLSNIGWILRELGRWEQALASTSETVEIRRRLARDNPADHEYPLGVETIYLGEILARLGRWEEALTAAAEGVEVFSRQDGKGAKGIDFYLTSAASILANTVAEEGWRERRPLKNIAKGLSEYASLVKEQSKEAALPGEDDEAAAGLRPAVEKIRRRLAAPVSQLYRQIAGSDLLAAEPLLAEVWSRLRMTPETAGLSAESAAALDVAIAACRRRARRNRDRHNPDLAAALSAKALLLRQLGKHEIVLAPAFEAVEIYRRLVPREPGVHEPALAAAWVLASVVTAELGFVETSTASMEQAIRIRRQLARHDPAAYGPALAAELAILGRILGKQGRWEEALAVVSESYDIRQLDQTSSTTARDHLTAAEEFLAAHLTGPERRPEHLAALHHAATDRRRRTAT